MAVPERLIDLPERIVNRLIIDFIVRCATAGGALIGGPILWWMLTAIRAAGRTGSTGAISVNALALSLNQPYETVRRHVIELMAAGLCQRAAGGLAAVDDPRTRACEAAVWDAFVRMIDDLRHLGFDFNAPNPVAEAAPPTAQPTPPARRSSAAIGGEGAYPTVETFFLRCVEAGFDAHGQDILRALILLAVMCGNTTHITYDPTQAWRYSRSHTPPPDIERQPVSIRSVAAALGLPAETVRRRINGMIAQGICVRVGTGVIITTAAAQDEKLLRSGVLLNIAFHRMIADLKRQDFDFGA